MHLECTLKLGTTFALVRAQFTKNRVLNFELKLKISKEA